MEYWSIGVLEKWSIGDLLLLFTSESSPPFGTAHSFTEATVMRAG